MMVKVKFTLVEATKPPKMALVVQLYSFFNLGVRWD
jgi:hypothetical protein